MTTSETGRYIRAGRYDALVIGSGHAGCEAALCLSRLSLKTLVFTVSVDNIAYMPCNPHIGGSSKGHLVRELDALGGEMGKAIDETYLQIKMLNRSKGPAVHSLRAQADKAAYSSRMRHVLESQENLTIKQNEISAIVCEGTDDNRYEKRITGVVTTTGLLYEADIVILCAGTYLKARCLTGETISHNGPNGMPAANALSSSLISEGVGLRRFKTGTPARMDGRTLDYELMSPQYGDDEIVPFSFDTDPALMNRKQEKCYLTYTNEKTHEIIRNNIQRSPMYSGVIEGIGPRYCPSIEDKVVRFKDKLSHQVFIEPEGLYTNEVYVDGMSSSLPEDVQIKMYRTVAGMERCEIVKSAYAIEYDCLAPGQLRMSLESRTIEGLFFAGQINGSSGYEEAAVQGLYAAANAYNKIKGREPFFISRAEGYIGVLIDDLVTKELTEPYRMMTSRAEYRLLLRQDNADLRLRKKGYELGLISDAAHERLLEKESRIIEETKRLKATVIGTSDDIQDILVRYGSAPLKSGISLDELMRRPELTDRALFDIDPSYIPDDKLSREILEQTLIGIKYEGYIDRMMRQVDAFKKNEDRRIPHDIDYALIKSLRKEAMEKLIQLKPENIGQASRIGGVNPADIQVLLVYLKAMGEGHV